MCVCACSEQQQSGARDDFGVEESALEGEFLGSFFQRVSFFLHSLCGNVCVCTYIVLRRKP